MAVEAPDRAAVGNGTSPDPEEAVSQEVILDAGGGQLSFAIGGKKPTSAALKFTGGKVEVDGQFEKGQRVSIRVDAVVNAVGFHDGHDSKTGQVVSCERRQSARITGISLIEGD